MQLKFGKYKGCKVESLMIRRGPDVSGINYVKWLIKNNIAKGELLTAIKNEIIKQGYKNLQTWLETPFNSDDYYNGCYEGSYSLNIDLRCPDDYFYGHGTDYPEYY